ncbi:MAG: zinc ribbon domain-containing protein [Kiritimatiellae bacterium]|nr:zinc ribbon domain-containing protein [Kiritimatiellia bacterium]
MIRCPQCGYENAFGHIFCIQCRAKLDIQTLDSEALSEPKGNTGSGRGRRLLWLAIFAGIVACMALVLWPAPLEGRKGTVADAQQARKKILLLEQGLSPASQLFAEREINAYIGLLLRNVNTTRTRGVWTTVLQAAEVAIRPNAITISTASVWGPVMIGSLKLGPWNVTSQIIVVPEHGPVKPATHGAEFKWTIRSGRIGHLPLPGPVSVPATFALRELWTSSIRERVLLKAVTRLELEEGQITVAVQKRVWTSP